MTADHPSSSDAPSLVALRIGDAAERWSEAGFVVEHATIRLGPLAIECVGDADGPTTPTLVFDRRHPGGAEDLDGIGWSVGTPPGTTDTPAHPNGIGDIDHVVVMATSLDGVRRALVGAGLDIRRERPTRLGDTAITQVFAWAGPVLLEVVAPTEPDVATGRAAGSSVWGVAAVAADLDATAAWFGDHISSPRPAVQRGRRIATVRHRDLGLSTQLAIMTPR